jgi:hypothetical protein
MNLLAVNADYKTRKGVALGYLTGILYLVPADGSGLGNLCPHASAGCRAACLYTAGRGRTAPVKAGRMRKTRLFFDNAARFVDLLAIDIQKLINRANAAGLTPCVRLNGTSDVPWERMRGTAGRTLMEMFGDIQFYDYTKRPDRGLYDAEGYITEDANYHLTFSRSECNDAQAMLELERGRNVAVVFATPKGQALPLFWRGYRVVDGDTSDLRFLDDSPCIIGLRGKGDAKQDTSGFVVIANDVQCGEIIAPKGV